MTATAVQGAIAEIKAQYARDHVPVTAEQLKKVIAKAGDKWGTKEKSAMYEFFQDIRENRTDLTFDTGPKISGPLAAIQRERRAKEGKDPMAVVDGYFNDQRSRMDYTEAGIFSNGRTYQQQQADSINGYFEGGKKGLAVGAVLGGAAAGAYMGAKLGGAVGMFGTPLGMAVGIAAGAAAGALIGGAIGWFVGSEIGQKSAVLGIGKTDPDDE
jgi:hypothetical protein